MGKLLIIGGVIAALFLLGWFIPPPDGFFGATDDTTIAKLAEKYDNAPEIKALYNLDGGALVRTDIKNPELDKYKNEPKDEIRVAIGEKSNPQMLGGVTNIEPKLTLTRWNEVGFSVKPKAYASVAPKNRTLTFEGEKTIFETPEMKYELYPYTEDEGGYKYVWYLKSKPATNKVEFQIESSGLDFFYQPPLTQEYQNGYSEQFQKEIIVSETQIKDLDGNVLVERPENVVGSYAVYHSTKGGMVDSYGKDYKVGKAFHIFRPHLIDANGLEAWGNLHIENGIYSVEIPQDFLDNAVYPIKSNDTFGYDPLNHGGTQGNSPYFIECKYTSPANLGTITQISTYGAMVTSPGALGNAIYSDVVGVPTTQLAVDSGNVTVATTTFQYWTTNISYAGSPSTVYWLAWFPQGAFYYYYDTGTTNQLHTNFTPTFENWPPIPTVAPNSYYVAREASIYATYTPSGGGATTVVPDLILNSGQMIINSGQVIVN